MSRKIVRSGGQQNFKWGGQKRAVFDQDLKDVRDLEEECPSQGQIMCKGPEVDSYLLYLSDGKGTLFYF